jgi:hypothetical protein
MHAALQLSGKTPEVFVKFRLINKVTVDQEKPEHPGISVKTRGTRQK